MKQIYIAGEPYQDVNPLFAGVEQCERGQSFGPTIREYTLIHYIFSGTGIFRSGGIEYTVNPGQIFVIRPGEVTYYEASPLQPWEYLWIAFDGRLSLKFSDMEKPVMRASKPVFEEIRAYIEKNRIDSFLLLSCIYQLFAELFNQEEHDVPADHYAKAVKRYIQMKYMDDISVERIAEEMHLNRRYLTRLFKARYDMTIRDYLIQVRIERAKKYLRDGFSVHETASMVGYTDGFTFSKIFKNVTGTAPSKYSKSERTEKTAKNEMINEEI